MGRCPLQSSPQTQQAWWKAYLGPHDSSDLTLSMWRTATIQGLPQSVQAKLEDCVGLEDMVGAECQAQVTHHMNKHTEAQDKYDDEMKVLQRRLMVAQVSEHEGTKAERKAAAAAKAVKPPTAAEVADLVVKQMTAIQPPPAPQPQMQTPPLYYGPQQQQQYGQQQQPQGPYQHQPQGGRGGWDPSKWGPHMVEAMTNPEDHLTSQPPQRQANIPYPVPYDVDPATQAPLREWRNQ
ncbi:unnamed protein product [Pleuronectes platessa]|uniref:Uncharacterized protein n=1 Tax=Pleuronectes platessa TaxID=8262 RepID=A0A9N7VS57_PLEPL|nr:unnamed protein product [Pleuronectes platessa]